MISRTSTLAARAAAAFGLGTFLVASGDVVAQQASQNPASERTLAGLHGPGLSAISVFNLESRHPLTSTLRFHREGGGAPTTLERRSIRSMESTDVVLPQEPSLAEGKYAVAVRSDRGHGVASRTDWPASGAAAMVGASRSGLQVDVPTWRGAGGLNSLVNIQNMDPAQPVTVTLRIDGPSGVALVDSSKPIAAGAFITLDLGRDPLFAMLPSSQSSVLRLTAPSPIAVQSFVDAADSARAVFSFAVTPADQARSIWFAPRLRADGTMTGGLRHASRMEVVNSGAQDVSAILTYRGMAGACAGQTIVHGPGVIRVPAGGSMTFYQDTPLVDHRAGDSNLPKPCSASATLTTSDAVTAYVVDLAWDAVTGQTGAAAAYSAATIGQGLGNQLLVPLWRNNQTTARLSADLTIFNPGKGPAEGIVALLGEAGDHGCSEACSFHLAPGEAKLLRPEDLGGAFGKSGTALIESDQPLVVLVEDQSRNGRVDVAADLALTYDTPTFTAEEVAALPLVLKAPIDPVPTGSPAPTPTPRPGPPPMWSLYTIGFVDAVGGTDPSCTGCDGYYSPADEAHAQGQPLGSFEIKVRNGANQVVATAVTASLATLQRGRVEVPPLRAGDVYRLEVISPAGWQVCDSVSDRGLLRPEDFPLGVARVDYYFNHRVCPPIGATSTPSSARPEPTLAAPVPKLQGSTEFAVRYWGMPLGTVQFQLIDALSRQTTIERSGLPQGGLTRLNLDGVEVSEGVHGALIYSASPIGALSKTGWGDAWAALDAAQPGTDVVVPLAVKGPLGLNTLLAVQNLNSLAEAEVMLSALGPDGRLIAATSFSVPAGVTRALDLGRDPSLAGIEVGFVGSLRLRSVTRIAVQAILDFEHGRTAVAGFNGDPAVVAAPVLFVPRVQSRMPADPRQPAAGVSLSRLSVVNLGPSEAAVTVRYLGNAGACAEQTYQGRTQAVAGNGMIWFDVHHDGLPSGCAAAAIIEARGGVGLLAMGLDTVQAGDQLRVAAAYNAFGTAQGARKVSLPSIRRLHEGISSEVSIQNLGEGPVSAELRLFDELGQLQECGDSCRLTLAAGAGETIRGEQIAGLHSGKLVSGWVEADGPVVVLVAEIARTLRVDETIYAGQAQADASTGLLDPLAFPLALAKASLRLLGPPLTPYEPPRFAPPDGSILSGVQQLKTVFLPRIALQRR